MSAHHPESDLALLARVQPLSRVAVDPHTAAVLRLARSWYDRSNGAFDPVMAADRLALCGRRPAFDGVTVVPGATLRYLKVDSASSVSLTGPLRLDLGGIAKGYAVDQAIEALQRHGVASAMVNAGGDMRAIGPLLWPVEIRHAQITSRSQRLRGLCGLRNAALATSVASPVNPEFVVTMARRRRMPVWQRCTVLARDCVSADVLTKWGLQAPAQSLRLKAALRLHGARVWRN